MMLLPIKAPTDYLHECVVPEVYQWAIGQAEASARRVRQMLAEAFGQDGVKVPVRSVLLVVGWWVEEQGQDLRAPGGLWALNPKNFYRHANRASDC
ncbi:MAG: hypothetical protein AAGE65_05065 [Planctomycetota bacterium]